MHEAVRFVFWAIGLALAAVLLHVGLTATANTNWQVGAIAARTCQSCH